MQEVYIMAELSLLRKRAEIIQETRNFFISNNYLEIETPVLSPHLIPESHLEVFSTKLINPYTNRHEQGTEFYLTPSPEIWMKKILSQSSGSIFQITKSFRNSEQKGLHHNPEFTMLEWYTEDADYKDSIAVTEAFLSRLADVFSCRSISPPFEIISMKELFFRHTSVDIEKCRTARQLLDAAEKTGAVSRDEKRAGYSWEEAFNYLFVSAVEPEIQKDRPVLITDYPDQIPCLAKHSRSGPWHERWELYLNGIETVNCYTEETDRDKADHFFKNQAELKKDSLISHKTDSSYTEIFSGCFPECSGAALGIDRLVMAITGTEKIQDVISFTF
jgi:lysyl-tRNA synthetase class 2